MSEQDLPIRLYLTIPATISDADLAALIAAGDVACVAVTGADEANARRLLAIAREADIAFLLVDAAELAKLVDADGVHLTDPEGYEAARAIVTAEGICGVEAGVSRHLAMEAAEAGADYVAIGPDAELVDFWVAAMTVPCVVWGIEDAAVAAEMADLGADFVALTGPLLSAAAIAALQEKIGSAG